jgi:hypothetical protein
MGQQVSILYKEFYSFVDEKTGELVQGGKIQIHDPKSFINERGRVGCPANFFKCQFSVASQIADDKIPGKYEIETVRIPKKDGTSDERVTSVKYLG